MTAVLLSLPLSRRRGAGFRLFRVPFDLSRDHLYAVGFVGGVVKIGRSCHVRDRLRTYWRMTPDGVEWAHVFASMPRAEAMRAERAALPYLRAIASKNHGREWFEGVTRSQALEAVRGGIRGALLP